jgi:NIPSNAP
MSDFMRYGLSMKKRAPALNSSESAMPLTRRSFLAGAAAMSLAEALPVFGANRKVSEDTVFELRQYTLYGGRRDTLIELFEKNFIESQEVVDAHIIGTFRDLDDPDRFVWIRGFRDMAARQQALEAFYGHSPAWTAHKKEANATMVDSDNVLLLHTLSSAPEFSSETPNASASNTVYGVTIYYLGGVDTLQFAQFFEHIMLPHLQTLGVHPIAILATNDVTNNFPRLPVREHDRVFLWMARWPSEADYESFSTQLRGWSGWRDTAPDSVLPALMRKPERLRLKPTTLSKLQ